MVDLNPTRCPLMLSLLPRPSSSSHRLNIYVCVYCGEGRSVLSIDLVFQRALFKRHTPKSSTVRMILFLKAPCGTFCTALHLSPKGLSYPETVACTEWPLAVPGPARECKDSVISFPQLLLRNSRPATGPRIELKITSGFQTESSVLLGGFAGVRKGLEGLGQSL